MSLSDAIGRLKNHLPQSKEEAQDFLDSIPEDVQTQLIAAIYIGREHIHCSELRKDMEISRKYTDHISKSEYAEIINEKGVNIRTYLSKLEDCARVSGFDINKL